MRRNNLIAGTVESGGGQFVVRGVKVEEREIGRYLYLKL
jgi:hypothetical protein